MVNYFFEELLSEVPKVVVDSPKRGGGELGL